jgi:hypothetical protein
MFLRRKYRDRMIGLIGAYALLVTGIVFTGSFDSAIVERPKTEKADEHSSALRERSDSVC